MLSRWKKAAAALVVASMFIACSESAARSSSVPDRKGLFAVIETTRGNLVVELFPASAPKTVENFIKLSSEGFYDGHKFHRVIPGFMAQTGDPTGSGSGGPGYTFKDEISATALGLDRMRLKESLDYYRNQASQLASMMVVARLNIQHQVEWEQRRDEVEVEFRRVAQEIEDVTVSAVLEGIGYEFQNNLPSKLAVRGALAMANSGPNSNGSQFFINQVDTPHLNGLHTVFGMLEDASSPVLDRVIDAGNGNTNIKTIEIFDRR